MRRPLEGSYWTTFAIVMIALCPNIVLTTAWTLVTKQIGRSVALNGSGLEVTEGLSNAGYALGALIGGDLTQRFRQRPLHRASSRCSHSRACSPPSRPAGRSSRSAAFCRGSQPASCS